MLRYTPETLSRFISQCFDLLGVRVLRLARVVVGRCWFVSHVLWWWWLIWVRRAADRIAGPGLGKKALEGTMLGLSGFCANVSLCLPRLALSVMASTWVSAWKRSMQDRTDLSVNLRHRHPGHPRSAATVAGGSGTQAGYCAAVSVPARLAPLDTHGRLVLVVSAQTAH